MTPPAKYEGVILVRVDNMTSEQAEAQLAIRFSVDVDKLPRVETLPEAIQQLCQAALDQAPPVSEWTASGFPR